MDDQEIGDDGTSGKNDKKRKAATIRGDKGSPKKKPNENNVAAKRSSPRLQRNVATELKPPFPEQVTDYKCNESNIGTANVDDSTRFMDVYGASIYSDSANHAAMITEFIKKINMVRHYYIYIIYIYIY